MKIGFCGTHSTGKTTMVEALRTEPYFQPHYHFDVNVTRWVNSLGFKINEGTSEQGQEINLVKRVAHLNSYEDMVADRTIIDVLAYSKAGNKRGTVSGKSLEYQFEMVRANIEKYDYIFYLPMDIEVTDDGVRAIDPEYRKEIDSLIIEYLKGFNVDYHTVTGSVRSRVQLIMDIIEEWSKYELKRS